MYMYMYMHNFQWLFFVLNENSDMILRRKKWFIHCVTENAHVHVHVLYILCTIQPVHVYIYLFLYIHIFHICCIFLTLINPHNTYSVYILCTEK